MARRKGTINKRTIIDEEIPAGSATNEEEFTFADKSAKLANDLVEEIGDPLASIRERFGPEPLRIKVCKFNKNRRLEFCYWSDGSFDESHAQLNFGGGHYVLKLYAGEEYKESIEVHVAQPMAPALPNAAPSNGNDTMIVMLQQQNAALLQAILENRNSRSAEQSPITELVGAVKTVMDMQGGRDQSNPMDALLKGIELAKSLNSGNGDWKTEIVRTVKDLIPIAGQVAMAYAQPGAETTRTNPVIVENQSLPTALNTNALDSHHIEITKQTIGEMKPKARMGFSPDLVLDWLEANAGNDSKIQAVLHTVSTQSFDNLISHDNELKTEPMRSWFKTVYDGILEMMMPEIENADTQNGNNPDSAGTIGNVGHASANGDGSATFSATTKVS